MIIKKFSTKSNEIWFPRFIIHDDPKEAKELTEKDLADIIDMEKKDGLEYEITDKDKHWYYLRRVR